MVEGPCKGGGFTIRTWRATTLCLLLWMVTSADASFFRRRRGTAGGGGQDKVRQSGSGSRGIKRGKLGKVKDDVAWLLDDTSDGGWKPVRDDGHVQVWKRSMPDSDFVAIKSKASLDVSPEALFEVLTPGDIEIVRQYNPLVEDGNDLEVIDRDNKVSWSATMGIWPCRPRDFVTHIQRATLDDGSVAIVNSATTHTKAPVRSKYVRGEILHGVFHIKAGKSKKHSEFTMVHHFNPGGNIPPWLINWLAEGKPLTFVRKLEKVAEKWDQEAALSKSMPCKGRGFADKPCAFLLPSADCGEQGDQPILGGSPMDESRWGPLLTALTVAALTLYGWRVLDGWTAMSGEKGKPSSPLTAQSKVAKENKCNLVVAGVADASHAEEEKPGPPSPKESATDTQQEMGVEAVVGEENGGGTVVPDLNFGGTRNLRPHISGRVQNRKVSTTDGKVAEACSVELARGAFAAEIITETPLVASAVIQAADGELPRKKANPVRADNTARVLSGSLEPKLPLVGGEVASEEFDQLNVAVASDTSGKASSEGMVVGDVVVEAVHNEVAPANAMDEEETCGRGQTTEGETNNWEVDPGVTATKDAINGNGPGVKMQRGQATDEEVRRVSLVSEQVSF
ncbi:unnamed protein product [Scytosiphon promiscuus]